MKNVYILYGEEIVLKDDIVKEIRKNNQYWNYNKLILDNNKNESVVDIINESFMYLSTIDMFNMNSKILNIVVNNAKIAVEILTEILGYVGDNILIIDIRSSDARALTSSSIYKKNSSNIEIKKYSKLEEKDKASTIKAIHEYFNKYDIRFESKEVEKICAIYLYDSSEYSYTNIRHQLEMMKLISDEVLTKDDVDEFISMSFNGNFFILINEIFSSNNKRELMEFVETKFDLFKASEYISFLNIFIYAVKDYIRYENRCKCKNIYNYYQFKNSKLKINDSSSFLLKLSEINFYLRTSTKDIKEELIMCIWNHFDEK